MKISAPSLAVALIFFAQLISGCLIDSGNNSQTDDVSNDLLEDPPLYDCIDFQGLERCWHIHAPEGINKTTCGIISCPLVMDIHGFTDDVSRQMNVSGFDELANEFGFILVYPIGYETSWNAGWCCGEARDNSLDDVGLLLDIIDIVEENWSTDPNRVYVTGWSNGCAMTQKLVNSASHRITAAGCMAMYFIDDPSPEYQAVPIMEVHGVRDLFVHYGVGYGSSILFDGSLEGDEGAIQNMEYWAELNGCSGLTPDVEIIEWDYSVLGYTNCEHGSEVRLVSLNFAGHNPYLKDSPDQDIFPGNPTGIDTSRMVWEFVSQFSK